MATKSVRDQITEQFKNYSYEIQKDPHDPQRWINRARFFQKGYGDNRDNRWPFLAAADAYKVYRWFSKPDFRKKHGLYRISDSELEVMKLAAHQILVVALLDLNDIAMAGKFAAEPDTTLSLYQDEWDRLNHPKNYSPRIKAQRYPWIPEKYLDRTKHLLKLRQDLARHGLALRPSNVGPFDPNNLGVFAMRTFKKGDRLFEENVFIANEPTLKRSVVTYFIDGAIEDLEMGSPRHILDRPEIGALTASYNEVEEPFNFQILGINHMNRLEQKNAKLLWDLDFDMWVLCTAERRCSINEFELREEKNSERWGVVSPMTSLFQHSCEPNVQWGCQKGGMKVMIVKATRDIRKREEIYDSYIDERCDLEKRRDKLRRWIGCDCGCTKCVREEREKAEEDAQKEDSGMEMANSSTSSSETVPSREMDSDGDETMGET